MVETFGSSAGKSSDVNAGTTDWSVRPGFGPMIDFRFRIRTHNARAPENRCLISPREQRAWIGWQRHIGATDSGSAQALVVE